VKGAFFIVEPNRKELIEISRLHDAGSLKPFLSAVVPLEEAAAAYDRAFRDARGHGEVVIAVAA